VRILTVDQKQCGGDVTDLKYHVLVLYSTDWYYALTMKVVLLYLLQHVLGSWMIAHFSVLTAGLGILLGLVSHGILYLFVTGFGSVHETINCKEPSTGTYAVRIMTIIEDRLSIAL